MVLDCNHPGQNHQQVPGTIRLLDWGILELRDSGGFPRLFKYLQKNPRKRLIEGGGAGGPVRLVVANDSSWSI